MQNSQRLCDLMAHIEADLVLLREYEDELRLEGDPKRKAKYRREIERLRESATNYQREFDDLQRQAAHSLVVTPNNSEPLHQVHVKLDALALGISEVLINQQQAMSVAEKLRQTLLAHYETSAQGIIAVLSERLDQKQLVAAQAAVVAIEQGQVSADELGQLLSETRQVLALLRQQGSALPQQTEVEAVIEDTALDIKHKLKFVIPLIFLEYEGEIELGSGVNLSELWRKLKQKIRK